MKGVALSDLHLGFRGAGRIAGGRNVREMDVEAAWRAAVDLIVEESPDLVTVAGDVFHSIRPSFHAVKAWQDGVQRIREEAGALVVVIGGNHESPRTAETLTPNLVAARDATIITEPQRIVLRTKRTGERIAIACLPFVALQEERTHDVQPDESADVNILLIHAPVRSSLSPDALPPMYGGAAAYDVAAAEGFDIIACGDFHEFRVLSGHEEEFYDNIDGLGLGYHLGQRRPFAFYSGSIERTSSNIWNEMAAKGFVVYDTDLQVARFASIPTRPVNTWQPIDFAGPEDEAGFVVVDNTATGVNAALAQLLQMEQTRDALVRFLVEDFFRSERDLIDWALVRQLRERCVHFRLDIRYRERETASFGDRRERTHRSLADEAASYFSDDEPAVRAAAFGFLGLDLPQEVAHA